MGRCVDINTLFRGFTGGCPVSPQGGLYVRNNSWGSGVSMGPLLPPLDTLSAAQMLAPGVPQCVPVCEPLCYVKNARGL